MGMCCSRTAEYKQTENPDEIAYISLPKDEFDWHAFTNSGNIKVKAGSSTAGYYYAYAYMHQASAQVLVSVFPLKTYQIKSLRLTPAHPVTSTGCSLSEAGEIFALVVGWPAVMAGRCVHLWRTSLRPCQ